MTAFLDLTEKQTGRDILINVENILAICSRDEETTYSVFSKDFHAEVTESVEEIKGFIRRIRT